MESVISIVWLCILGLRHSLEGIYLATIFFVKDYNKASTTKSTTHTGKQRTVFEVLILCLGFGAIYMSAIYIFDYYFVGYFIKYLTSYLTPDEEYYYQLFGTVCSYQFNVCWTIFLFLLSRILSYSWFQEISDLTCAKIGMKASNQKGLSYALSDLINSAITESLFLAQAYAIYFFPLPDFIKHCIYILHLSLLYALYAFEYKWIQKGYDMNWRFAYVEAKWPYFLGFGLPLSCITCLVGSYIHSICLFSTIFPLYVMSSTITCGTQLRTFNQPLQVFKIVTMISDFLVGGLIEKKLKLVK